MLVLAHEMVQTYSALRLFAGVWDMQTLKLHVESSLEKLSLLGNGGSNSS
jgi:hypothetical protein